MADKDANCLIGSAVMDRTFVVLGALFGLLGTIAAGIAAHTTGPGTTLDAAASFLLFHAPTLIAIPALIHTGLAQAMMARAGGGLIFIGCALFSSEMALRAIEGESLFFMAAPSGGSLLIAGWLIIILAALAPIFKVQRGT